MKTIVITGPTASGKTEIAIEIAKKINGEIISADSMQIYKYMDIGTAKPTEDQRKEVKHHLVDIKEPCEPFSAGEFRKVALRIIEGIHSKGKRAIVVGGTGFYLDALVNGLDDVESVDEKVKLFFDDMCEEMGNYYLYEWLEIVDEKWTSNVPSSDCQRIKRGLSFYVDKGVPLSSLFSNKNKKGSEFLVFVLFASKDFLREKIRNRTEKMIEIGLIEETRRLLERGLGSCDQLKAIGYNETVNFLDGKIKTKNRLIEEIAKNTLSFAKRQLTFFKSRFKDARWIDVEKENPLTVILDAVSGHLS